MARELGLSKDDAERKPRAKPKPKAKGAAGGGGGAGRKRRVSNATTGVAKRCPGQSQLTSRVYAE